MKRLLILLLAAMLMTPAPEVEELNQNEVCNAPKVIEEQIPLPAAEEVLQEPIQTIEQQPYFNQYNLRELSNLTKEKIFKILEGTELQAVSSTYLDLEEAYQINAFFLIALSAHESGWGTSKRAIEQNNLTGFAVYSDEAEGGTFISWSQSLEHTAELLDQHYLTEGGMYFNGYGIEAVNTRYCLKEEKPDWNWSKSITSICYELLERS